VLLCLRRQGIEYLPVLTFEARRFHAATSSRCSPDPTVNRFLGTSPASF
jgi:hypothetical protein